MMTEQERIYRDTIQMLTKWNNGVEIRSSELHYFLQCLSNVSVEVKKTIRQRQLEKSC